MTLVAVPAEGRVTSGQSMLSFVVTAGTYSGASYAFGPPSRSGVFGAGDSGAQQM